ncbi:hypothetical protein BKA93DRAFT_749582 [Sparassis latifolia]
MGKTPGGARQSPARQNCTRMVVARAGELAQLAQLKFALLREETKNFAPKSPGGRDRGIAIQGQCANLALAICRARRGEVARFCQQHYRQPCNQSQCHKQAASNEHVREFVGHRERVSTGAAGRGLHTIRATSATATHSLTMTARALKCGTVAFDCPCLLGENDQRYYQ